MIQYPKFLSLIVALITTTILLPMQRSQRLFPGSLEGWYSTRLGDQPVSNNVQRWWDDEQGKLNVGPIRLQRMNPITCTTNANNPAFTMPFSRTIWINNELEPSQRARVIYHETCHIINHDPEKRFFEYYSAPFLGMASVACAVAAQAISKVPNIKRRLNGFSGIFALTGISKTALDTTDWYKEQRRQWIHSQELRAQEYVINNHPNPAQLLQELERERLS